MPNTMTSYKEQHEQFVSDNMGTTQLEIMCVVGSAPLGVLVRNLMVAWIFTGEKNINFGLKFALDFLALIVPVLLCFTMLADHLDMMYWILLFIVVGLMICSERVSPVKMPLFCKEMLDIPMQGKRPFITNFRAYVNIAGAISILAVDFQVFPRRFAKAETFGTGLMDVGVGAYVVSNAIVSAEARGKYPPCRSLRHVVTPIAASCVSTIPLWVLGLARLGAVKATDYHEHVTEYGVHWNFFFTLAVVKVLSTMILCLVDSKRSWLIAAGIGALYQWFLSNGLSLYLENGVDGKGGRQGGIVDANREGIYSCLGYLAIYFAGVQLGRYVFIKRSTVREWIGCLVGLVGMSVIAWSVLSVLTENVEPVSRRFANLPYLVWLVAYSLTMFVMFLGVDIAAEVFRASGFERTLPGVKPAHLQAPCMLEAINRNGLFYFLLLNLQTGLVNLSVRTMYASDHVAVVILLVHLLTLSITVEWLHVHNITLKFW